MSAYLTDQELIDGHLPGDVASRSTPDTRSQAVETASSEADGYLRQAGYSLPLTNWQRDLEGAVGAIAAYRLASKLGLVPQPAKDSDLYLNFKAAIAWLEGVAAGKVKLELDSDTPATPKTGGPLVFTKPPRGW